MHCPLCYSTAQHLSVHSRREEEKLIHTHTENAKEKRRGKKMEMERVRANRRQGLKNEWPSRTGCIHRQTL